MCREFFTVLTTNDVASKIVGAWEESVTNHTLKCRFCGSNVTEVTVTVNMIIVRCNVVTSKATVRTGVIWRDG